MKINWRLLLHILIWCKEWHLNLLSQDILFRALFLLFVRRHNCKYTFTKIFDHMVIFWTPESNFSVIWLRFSVPTESHLARILHDLTSRNKMKNTWWFTAIRQGCQPATKLSEKWQTIPARNFLICRSSNCFSCDWTKFLDVEFVRFYFCKNKNFFLLILKIFKYLTSKICNIQWHG